MNLTINIIEVASTLAHAQAMDEMIQKGLIDNEDEMWQGEEGEDNEGNYTPAAQEIYDVCYDYFFNVINELKIK